MRISDWSSDVCSSDLLFDQFGIKLLVRIDGVVARVIKRNAVEGQADTVFRKAADRELATRRTISVVVGEDDTGDEVDRVEDRLAGILARDDFLTEQIGIAPVCTPVTNAPLVCRLLLEKNK